MGKDHCTADLQFNKAGLGQEIKQVVFVRSEPAESKLGKLETSCTVTLPQWGVFFALTDDFWALGEPARIVISKENA